MDEYGLTPESIDNLIERYCYDEDDEDTPEYVITDDETD